jgi:hypothetical protein
MDREKRRSGEKLGEGKRGMGETGKMEEQVYSGLKVRLKGFEALEGERFRL